MKKTFITIVALFIILTSAIYLAACNDTTDEGVETPPASDESNNAQEPTEVQDPGYSRIEYKSITVYDTVNPVNDTPIPGVGAEDAYPRERYFVFIPTYTSDYEILTYIGETGTVKINDEIYEANGVQGYTSIKLRMTQGEVYYIDIKLGEEFKAYRFSFGLFTHTGFDNVTIAPGEKYVVRVSAEETGVKRYISQNPAIVFFSLYKRDKDIDGSYVTDSHFSGVNMSPRLDVYFGSAGNDDFKYIIFENVSDTEQTLEVTEEGIESVSLNEAFEIDWKSGEGYYFVKYVETGAAEEKVSREVLLTTNEYQYFALDSQGKSYGRATPRPMSFVIDIENGTYYLGFRFQYKKDGIYTITIKD